MRILELMEGIQTMNQIQDVEIKSVSSHSKEIRQGDVYICLAKGFDKIRAYCVEALSRGASCVVAQENVLPDSGRLIQVADIGRAFAHLAANYYGRPADKLKLIGVTGTNGKTTTTYLLRDILKAAGKKTGLIGTIQNESGAHVTASHLTTPEPMELHQLFFDMVEAGTEYVVMECSSQALAQNRLYGLKFEIGIFTNLTHDHLDYHQTMEAYINAKKILFEQSSIAVLNKDDAHAEDMNRSAAGTVTYSVRQNSADYIAKNMKMSVRGVQYELVGNSCIARITVCMPGVFTVYNSMAAAVAAMKLGIPLETAARSLSAVKGVKGRMELVPTDTNYAVVIDYAHTPDALENILNCLRPVCKGRLITLFGCGGDRDVTKRPEMGRVASELSDFCVITSDNPRTEDPMVIIKDIMQGIDTKRAGYKIVPDRRQAIALALEYAGHGEDDIVLLAGKGHEDYQVLADRTIHLDEREVVAELLREMIEA